MLSSINMQEKGHIIIRKVRIKITQTRTFIGSGLVVSDDKAGVVSPEIHEKRIVPEENVIDLESHPYPGQNDRS